MPGRIANSPEADDRARGEKTRVRSLVHGSRESAEPNVLRRPTERCAASCRRLTWERWSGCPRADGPRTRRRARRGAVRRRRRLFFFAEFFVEHILHIYASRASTPITHHHSQTASALARGPNHAPHRTNCARGPFFPLLRWLGPWGPWDHHHGAAVVLRGHRGAIDSRGRRSGC